MSQSPYFWDHLGVRITVLTRDLQHSRHTNVCIWPWLALVSIFEHFWMLSNFAVANQIQFCIVFCKDTISCDHMPTGTVGDWFKCSLEITGLAYDICICDCFVDGVSFNLLCKWLINKYPTLWTWNNLEKKTSSAKPSVSVTWHEQNHSVSLVLRAWCMSKTSNLDLNHSLTALIQSNCEKQKKFWGSEWVIYSGAEWLAVFANGVGETDPGSSKCSTTIHPNQYK